MANLPSDRTKLQVAVSNQQASIIASAQANRETLIEAYDTIDLLHQFVTGLIAGGTLQPYPAFMSRQALINGNFDIWQRGTSFTAANGYTADRWVLSNFSGTASRQSFTPGQASVPNEPVYFLNLNQTGTSSFTRIEQRIEDVRTFAGKKITLSFWAKSAASSPIKFVSVMQNFGSGGSSLIETTIKGTDTALTSSWQYFTFTVTLPSITGKTIGASSYISINLYGTTGSASTFNIDVAQVQVNAGDAAVPFQPRSFAEELTLCQRYYEKSFTDNIAPAQNTGSLSGAFFAPQVVAASGGMLMGCVFFTVRKRTSPTVTLYNPSAANAQARNVNGGKDCSGTTVENQAESAFSIFLTTNAVSGTGDRLAVHWTAEVEL